MSRIYRDVHIALIAALLLLAVAVEAVAGQRAETAESVAKIGASTRILH
ncbi:hypothetical protein [Tropicimonas marinistellae]|nr:hypothetical protein [Tropicimonas marinistellae]